MASLARLAVVVAWTCPRVSVDPSCSLPRFHDLAPPSLPRVLTGGVPLLPRYDEVLRPPASIAPHFVAFVGRSQAVRPSFRSQRSRSPNRGPGVRHPVPTYRTSHAWRRSGSPRFLEHPDVPTPCSPTPAGPTRPALTTRSARPRSVHGEGSHDGTRGAPSQSLGTRRRRFVACVAPSRRPTAFPRRARSTGRDG